MTDSVEKYLADASNPKKNFYVVKNSSEDGLKITLSREKKILLCGSKFYWGWIKNHFISNFLMRTCTEFLWPLLLLQFYFYYLLIFSFVYFALNYSYLQAIFCKGSVYE